MMESNSEAYVEYTGLLQRLQGLIRRGEDESTEGDELRDAMDGSWYRLTESERGRVAILGASLNSIGGPAGLADGASSQNRSEPDVKPDAS